MAKLELKKVIKFNFLSKKNSVCPGQIRPGKRGKVLVDIVVLCGVGWFISHS